MSDLRFLFRYEMCIRDSSIKSQVKGYALTVEEKDGVKETISGSDISLAYKKNDSIEKALKSQNAFLWPQAFFKPSSADIKVDVSYDKDALNEKIQQLKCISEVEPVSYTHLEKASAPLEGHLYGAKASVSGSRCNLLRQDNGFHQYMFLDLVIWI